MLAQLFISFIAHQDLLNSDLPGHGFLFYSILRARGHFGNVTVFWQLFANDSVRPLEEHEEFTNTSGSVTFTTGEESKPIILQAVSDKLPEFNEFFVLRLVNISGESNGSF